VREAGKDQQDYLIVKMNDIIITGVTDGDASGQAGSETVSLVFAKIDLEYKPQKADGSLDTGIHFKYDLKANKEG
jgi:type VI secretion system secreted protein Hcp